MERVQGVVEFYRVAYETSRKGRMVSGDLDERI
jgi:hypothetical protein